MYRHYDNGENNRQGPRRFARASTLGIVLLLALGSGAIDAQDGSSQEDDVWDRAVAAMQNNELAQAVTLLEVVVSRDADNTEAVRYLAVALEQTEREARAETALRDALGRDGLSPDGKSKLAFDLAMLLSRRGDRHQAIEMYSQALEHDSSRTAAYLNRANLRVATEEYEGAVTDYEYFLAVRPDTDQRPQIEEMIALLQETIEAERIAEEERRRREEEERRAAEERRQRMMDSVLQSLETADEETTSVEAEDEELRSYDDELDIVD